MVSVAECPHLGQVIVDCRTGAALGIEIARDQQDNAKAQADERQDTHGRWRAHPVRPASRGVTLLAPQQERPSGESQRSDHQKRGPERQPMRFPLARRCRARG
jgi:hypothetical protein